MDPCTSNIGGIRTAAALAPMNRCREHWKGEHKEGIED